MRLHPMIRQPTMVRFPPDGIFHHYYAICVCRECFDYDDEDGIMMVRGEPRIVPTMTICGIKWVYDSFEHDASESDSDKE